LSIKKRNENLKFLLREPCIVIGTRSSLFLPIKNLKVIIADEIHDKSYTQESYPFYDTYEILKSIKTKKIFLSTSTPNSRIVKDIDNKEISLIKDSNLNKFKLKIESIESEEISNELIRELTKNHQKNKISLIYLNHRGYSNRIIEHKNYSFIKCKFCFKNLFFHKEKKS